MQGVPAGQGGEKSERPRPQVKPEKKERGGGPLVVVRRASGAVETRTMEEPKSAPATAGGEDAPAADAPKADAPKAEVVVVAKAAPLPSVADDVHEGESFAEMFETSGNMPSKKQ